MNDSPLIRLLLRVAFAFFVLGVVSGGIALRSCVLAIDHAREGATP